MMAVPAGLFAAMLGGGPLPLPKLACGVCTALAATLDPEHGIQTATTLYGGTLVCAPHAADELARAERVADAMVQLVRSAFDTFEADTPPASIPTSQELDAELVDARGIGGWSGQVAAAEAAGH